MAVIILVKQCMRNKKIYNFRLVRDNYKIIFKTIILLSNKFKNSSKSLSLIQKANHVTVRSLSIVTVLITWSNQASKIERTVEDRVSSTEHSWGPNVLRPNGGKCIRHY